MSYVYRFKGHNCREGAERVETWEVGYFHPGDNQFIVESEHPSKDRAAERVHWLNGGESKSDRALDRRAMEQLTHALNRMPSSVRMRF